MNHREPALLFGFRTNDRFARAPPDAKIFFGQPHSDQEHSTPKDLPAQLRTLFLQSLPSVKS
jgi:hypothetical protein